jgi:hypothetical protein|eukprot:776210-Prymnesium_polylepis.3
MALAQAARQMGMLGNGSLWVVGDGFSVESDLRSTSAATRAALDGLIKVEAIGADDANPRWQRLAREWPRLEPAPFNARLPAAWALPANFFAAADVSSSSLLRGPAAYEYDAIAAAGMLACLASPVGAPPADFGTRVWQLRRNLTFGGLSGDVVLDAAGDRAWQVLIWHAPSLIWRAPSLIWHAPSLI